MKKIILFVLGLIFLAGCGKNEISKPEDYKNLSGYYINMQNYSIPNTIFYNKKKFIKKSIYKQGMMGIETNFYVYSISGSNINDSNQLYNTGEYIIIYDLDLNDMSKKNTNGNKYSFQDFLNYSEFELNRGNELYSGKNIWSFRDNYIFEGWSVLKYQKPNLVQNCIFKSLNKQYEILYNSGVNDGINLNEKIELFKKLKYLQGSFCKAILEAK